MNITGRLVTPEGVRRGTLRMEDGRIAEVLAPEQAADTGRDFGDALIVPGFIDMHLHGLGNFGIYEVDDIVGAAAMQVTFGATGFMPGVASLTEERYMEFGRNVRQAQENAAPRTAAVIGAHFEGPFINEVRKGGMMAEFLHPVDLAEAQRYLDEVGDVMRMMTISPELPDALEIVRLMYDHGVVVSMGHTDAEPEQVEAIVEAGVRQVCHLFNTFDKPIEPLGLWPRSLITSILANDALNCEVICDMKHVLPEYVKVCARVLAPSRFIAITDSMTGAGFPPGEYKMVDGRVYTTRDGIGALVEDDGKIVGSVLTMNRAFGNLVDVVGLDPVLAARFTSTNAARALRLDDAGVIAPHMRADLAVLDDSFDCIATFVRGELAHEA